MGEGRILLGNLTQEHAHTPAWYKFDPAWYRRRYGMTFSEDEKAYSDDDLTTLWEMDEGESGHSPNRYFDEKWYLQNNPDVLRSVREKGIFASGFQHYVEVGCPSCAAHWLFSLEYYLKNNKDYTAHAILRDGYVNVYDHYLRVGDRHFRKAHPLFNPEIFLQECLKNNIPFDFQRGAVEQYLSLEEPEMGFVRTSWYFDPSWYLKTYPEVQELIEQGVFINPLHHYVACEEAERYNPNPYFKEEYYLTRYPDVKEAVDQGIFRNGYAHFVRTGAGEKRQPSEGVDLDVFAQTLNLPHDLNIAHADDVFVLWIMRQEGMFQAAPVPELSEQVSRALAMEKIIACLPSLFRYPLHFESFNEPPLSIILLSSGQYLQDIATLISLHEQNIAGVQIIIASTGNDLAKLRLEQCVKGVQGIFFEERSSLKKRVRDALRYVRSQKVLLIEAGMHMLPMALSPILPFLQKEHVGGGGKILSTNNRILEAGSALWRNGTATAYGNEQRRDVQREVEAVQAGVLFAHRKGFIKALDSLEVCPSQNFFAFLSVALRYVGETLSYLPTVQVKRLTDVEGEYVLPPAAGEQLRRLFPAFLSAHAISAGDGLVGKAQRPYVMMVFSHLPRQEEGGPAQRIMGHIKMFCRLGWQVLVVGLRRGAEDRLTVSYDYPESVECLAGIEDFQDLLQKRQLGLKLLWVNGTDTLNQIGACLASGVVSFSERAIILDTVSQHGPGVKASEAYLRRVVGGQNDVDFLQEETKKELRYAWLCQSIIVGDTVEAELLQKMGYGNVMMLPYAVSCKSQTIENEPAEREGLLFPLSIYESGDAGHEGFNWFCLSVMPYLHKHFGEHLPIWVVGYHHDMVDLSFYGRLASLYGFAKSEQLPELIKKCRVLIVPSRVLSTQATEIFEAGAAGLPAVISTPQMERLGWKDGVEALDGGLNNPEYFASQLIKLYEDHTLWSTLSRQVRNCVSQRHNEALLERALEELLAFAFGKAQQPYSYAVHKEKNSERVFSPAPLRVDLTMCRQASPSSIEDEEEEAEHESMVLPTHLGVTLP